MGEIIKRSLYISIGLFIAWLHYQFEFPNVDRLAGIGLGIVWLLYGILSDREQQRFRLPAGWPDWIALLVPGLYVAWIALRTNWLAPDRKDFLNMVWGLIAIAIYTQPWMLRPR